MGTSLGQFFGFLLLPLVALYYKPEQFGYYSLVLSVCGFCQIAATLQLNSFIAVAKSKKRSFEILILGLFVALIFLLMSLIFASALLRFVFPDISALTLISSFFISLFCSFNCLISAFLIRCNFIKFSGLLFNVRVLSSSFLQISLGYFFESANGLIFGYLFGEIVYFFCSLRFSINFRPKSGVFFRHRLVILFVNFKNHFSYSVFQELISSVSQSIPLYFLGFYYGNAVSGQYAFCQKIVQAPIQLIGNSFRSIISTEISEKAITFNLYNKYFKYTFFMILFLIFSFPIFNYSSTYLVQILFSKEWHQSVYFIPLILIGSFVSIFIIPSIVTLRLFFRYRDLFYFYLILFFVRFFSCLFIENDPLFMISLYTFGGLFCAIALVIFGFFVFKNKVCS